MDAFHRGRTHEAAGELQAARRCYREAAEAGHRAAAVSLGSLLASGVVSGVGELHDVWLRERWTMEPAEKWWRRGIHDLDAKSAAELGELLGWDPELVETERGLRAAYEAGDAQAGYWLASLLGERGCMQERGGFGDNEGWLREADDLLDAVWERTGRAEAAIRRTYDSWWYPVWLLRRHVAAGRVLWGLDAQALQAHARALARRKQRRPDDYMRRRLEREQAGGDIEATFLLGLIDQVDETWLRSAAEAGHRQAAYELGANRMRSRDDEGAVFWFRRAAAAGHPGASFELAWQWCTTDRQAAETECRKAVSAGHLRAAALLRVLDRDPGSSRPAPAGSREGRVAELLSSWDELSRLAPDPDRCVDYLSERSGLPRADIARVREVRDQCAHPAEHGRPSTYELDIALTTAGALRERTGLHDDDQA